jgi:competence protein ComEA
MNGKWGYVAVFLAGLFVGAGLGVATMVLNGQTRPAPMVIEPAPAPQATATPAPLHVYVSGAVAHAAVYELPAGAIVGDAVERAGSFTEEAAVELVNLALPLHDGMHIHVPGREEAAGAVPPVVGDPAGGLAPSALTTARGGLVNINTATLAELDTLPGVGPSTAQKILDYRAANGPFGRIEEIMEVSGIGEGKFEQMKELITVE